MSRLTKTMSALLGILVLYGLVSTVVYPRWVEPLLTIDQRIADRRKEYDELQALEDEVGRAKEAYRSFVSRVGSFDVGKVETAIRARLNELIEKHQLQAAKVSPRKPRVDRKTHVTTIEIMVTSVGTLQSAVEFLKDVAEFPQLVRVGNTAIYPASRSRRKQGEQRMNLRVPIKVLVLPQHRIVGRLEESRLQQPERFVRHADRNYSAIWSGKPFTQPIPLKANAGRDINVEQGRPARLAASAIGGDGEYTFSWDQTEELSDATIPNPTIDTSTPFTRVYNVTVVDARGETAADNVRVTIRKSRRPPKHQKPVEKKPVDHRWADRKYRQLCMTLLHRAGSERVHELMIYNNRSKRTEYYSVGAEFDGGELVFVHPRGAVVRRKDEYFIYPIGTWLDQDIKAGDAAADDYPELKEVARRLREAVKVGSKAEPETVVDTPTDEPNKTEGVTLSTANGKEVGDTGHARTKGRKPDVGNAGPATNTPRGGSGETRREHAAATQEKSKPAGAKRKSQPPRERKSKTRRIRKFPRNP